MSSCIVTKTHTHTHIVILISISRFQTYFWTRYRFVISRIHWASRNCYCATSVIGKIYAVITIHWLKFRSFITSGWNSGPYYTWLNCDLDTVSKYQRNLIIFIFNKLSNYNCIPFNYTLPGGTIKTSWHLKLQLESLVWSNNSPNISIFW